jgi:hypothetical protein
MSALGERDTFPVGLAMERLMVSVSAYRESMRKEHRISGILAVSLRSDVSSVMEAF